MEAARDGMGKGRSREQCVPLITPGAAEQAEKPTEDHFKLGTPLITAHLLHPCVTIHIQG